MRKFIFLSVLSVLCWGQVASDQPFTGAETAALAGAVEANPASAASLFHNPAGLSELQHPFITVTTADYFGVNHMALGGFLRTKCGIPMGITIQQSNVDLSGITLSEETAVGISSAIDLQHDVNSRLILGTRVNYYHWSLGRTAGVSGDGSDGFPSESGTSYGIDLGIMATLRDKHRLGATLTNLNSPSIGEGNGQQNLPRRLSIATAYAPYHGLVTSLVLERVMGRDDIQIQGGFRYDLNDWFTLRLGVQSKPNRLGAGFGLVWNHLMLDYGLLTHPVLPEMHHFSVGYSF